MRLQLIGHSFGPPFHILGGDQYPDPLPTGLKAIVGSVWSVRVALNDFGPLKAVATLYDAEHEMIDRMTITGHFETSADPAIENAIYYADSASVEKGAQIGNALIPYPGPLNDVSTSLSVTHNSLGEEVYLWAGNQANWVGDNRINFPASNIPIPKGATIEVVDGDDVPMQFIAFMGMVAPLTVTAKLDAPQVTLTTTQVALTFPDSDSATRWAEFPDYASINGVTYWWQENGDGAWKSSSGATFAKDFFKSQYIYIVATDNLRGQVVVKKPLIIRDRVFATSDEVRTKHGRTLIAAETQPFTFAGGDGFNEITMNRYVEVFERIDNTLHRRFRQPGDAFEGFEWGTRGTPGLLVMRGGMVMFHYALAHVNHESGVIGGGGAYLMASRDEGSTWRGIGYMWTSGNIRAARLCQLTDGALATVAVSSADWVVDPLTETVTRKLLFKRSTSLLSSETDVLAVTWPDDADAVEIADLDRVEVWTIRQEKSGEIILRNGRGRRLTSATANPQSAGDFEESNDEVAT